MKFPKWFALVLMLLFTTIGIFATAYAQGGDTSRGAQLYAQNCAVCHGDRAQGRVGTMLAKDFPGIRVDALLGKVIADGVPGSAMDAWSRAKGGPLTDTEIDAIVAFIRSLGHQAPTALAQPVATATKGALASPVATFPPGDATRGDSIYSQNCAICHDERGEGRIGAMLGKDWPGINVESFLDATIARGVAGSKMPAWSRANGGPLTNQEIADVAAFVRTLKQPGQSPPVQAPGVPQGGALGGVLALACVGVVVLVGIAVLASVLAGAHTQ